jgi:hypothetical protein
MSSSFFVFLSLIINLIWILKSFVQLPIAPKLFNLPVIFSILFLLYYTQNVFLSEIVFNIPVKQWLPLSINEKSNAYTFLMSYLTIFWIAYVVHAPTQNYKGNLFKLNYASAGLVWLIMISSIFSIYVHSTGGIYEFITNHREAIYRNQWSNSADVIIVNKIRVIASLMFTAAAISGGYFLAVDDRAKIWQKILYFILPLPGAIVKIALLSRGAFLYYALFFMTKSVASRKKQQFFFLKLIVLSLIALLGVIYGMVERSNNEIILSSLDESVLFVSNSINGMQTFFDTFAISKFESGIEIFRIILELSPIPSFIFSSPYVSNLTTLIFGNSSGSSTPMPFIGEAYFNLGWAGLILAYLQGLLSALINSKVANPFICDRFWWILLYVATVYSFIYMPHSGIRSCTRPMVWVVIFFAMVRFVRLIMPDQPYHSSKK